MRIVGAHNGLTARLAEKCGFDGIWASGLEISTSYAVPDANIMTMSENLEIATIIQEASTLPVVCDCDTGYGDANNVMHMVKKYEARGIAAVVVEDKQFPKLNSFAQGRQELTPIPDFVEKIRAAKSVQLSEDFMFISRIEALIAGAGMEEALKRADAYAEAGTDAIVIHSKSKEPTEIKTFIREWGNRKPVIVIPTTYYKITYSEFQELGVSMVIYANHGIRAAIRAIESVFTQIVHDGCTTNVEEQIASLKEVFELQGMDRLQERRNRHEESIPVISANHENHVIQMKH
jgi:phosphoenolpyruvate phosphomutase